MLKLDISRLLFSARTQNRLLQAIKTQMGFTNKELACYFEISLRSLTNWLNEKTRLPLYAYKKTPHNLQGIYRPIKVVGRYAHTPIAGKKGYTSVIKKYGSIQVDEAVRKKAHIEWWQSIGKISSEITKLKYIKITKDKEKLSELIGIILGDGGVSNNQIKISLNSTTDKTYISYVSNLVNEVFDVMPSGLKRKNKKCIDICLSRKKAINYLVNLGIKIGNKKMQQVDVPLFIQKNKLLAKRCVRGLIDTDGSLFFEKKAGKYVYPRLNFTNTSKPLIEFVHKTLRKNNISSRLRRNGLSVQVENFNEICNYFKVFGSSNPKHTRKYDILVK